MDKDKALSEQVWNNAARFDIVVRFQLTKDEVAALSRVYLIAIQGTGGKGGRTSLPRSFTEWDKKIRMLLNVCTMSIRPPGKPAEGDKY
ncbi:MAG: hypothetical protein IJ088_12535 [Clostridia bacterium]|nr:hypothetical protein [Clostridia bacterium]